MGKGDLRTKRGKIYRGTHGKARPRRKKGKGREIKQE
ncbi:MAG: 30S ribosomal protein THX [Deltaproteobacteria bacterium]|nr:30S ribosomal protein THX [Deltaproteobacteria bacterium]MBW2078534.1 30S ribosomal protein THX [Deltaproteobacteria bacterium]MBW2311526.1 30S ribosomal protein THX [Deltaproteobacteria bacterium]RLB30232.1 MAG: 30S ribosomal protein THX [Deltaproteobacteria bacterium]